jgi:tRNA1(Val) A37 N6-methylase TrmN6
MHGDLRDLHLETRFSLITGSPPYFDVRAGIVPADSQKAHARFELRGDVRDYANTAIRHLTPEGLFVLCFPFAQKDRALSALRDAGFARIVHRDVVPRAGLPALFSLFACSVNGPTETSDAEPPFIVRNAEGTHTDHMHEVRSRFGWPVPQSQ